MTRHRVVNLFDVDDIEDVGRVSDMVVAPVSTGDVAEFTRRWHYTGGPGSALWRYGLWAGHVLVGVVAYNIPTLRTCASVFGAEHSSEVVHMGRLVCAEHAPRNSESRLIAASLKMLAADKPALRAVLTFAAEDAGHIGYVYQATNALYTGTGGYSKNYVKADGVSISTNGKCGPDEVARLAATGVTITAARPKHRYLYLLGDRRRRRSPSRYR